MINMQDNFSSYIAQLKTKYKDTTFNPLFFNGCLIDTGESQVKRIHLFLLMQPNEHFNKALNLNLKNPNIDSITVFSNFNDGDPISHNKLKYIMYSKYFGLQISDITRLFKENEINIFVYDTVVFDFDSILYSRHLTNTQFGIFSAKQFDDNIPDNLSMFKNVSSYKNVNTDFNGFVVLGKLQNYDLFLEMCGSINMLISYLENHEVINLSNIMVSYLFEKRVYEDTYISDNFPVIYAPFQLYFTEELRVVLPREDVLEIFSREIVDCVTIEHDYTQDALPLEDRELITNIKNKILSEMLLNYKAECEKQIQTIKLQCTELYNSTNEKNMKELDQIKQQKVAELDVFFEEKSEHRNEVLEIQYQKELKELSRKIKEAESVAEAEHERKRFTEFKKIDIEIQKKLDTETKKAEQVIEDSKKRASVAFKQEIELLSKTAYANLDEQIKQVREQKLREIDREMSVNSATQLEKMNKEHQTEKQRLDVVLREYNEFKQQEIESLHRTEYDKKLSSSLVEIKIYVESVKKEKLEEVQVELKKETETMYTNLRKTETLKEKEIDHKLKLYEQDSVTKVDSHIKELMTQRIKTEELRMDNELRLLRESKRKQMESEEIAKIKQECVIIKEGLLKHAELEIESFKHNEYDRRKLDVEEKIRIFHNEKMEEYQTLLEKQQIEHSNKQDVLLNELKEKKLRELDELITSKLSERTAELQSYKTEQLKEISLFLEKFKENELSKIELTKQLQNNELKEKMDKQEREIENELSTKRQEKIKEIKAELTKERKKISAELEKQFQETLEAKNKEQEKEYAAKLQEKFVILEKENEILFTNLLSSSKRQYDSYVEENKTEKNKLEQIVIEEHNKQLRVLEEEYQEKIDFHKSLLKDSIKDERQKLLASEKDAISKELESYKIERTAEIRQETVAKVAKLKEEQLLNIDREILSYKEKQMEAINIELAQWKKTQEESLKKKFQSLYSDLKDL